MCIARLQRTVGVIVTLLLKVGCDEVETIRFGALFLSCLVCVLTV